MTIHEMYRMPNHMKAFINWTILRSFSSAVTTTTTKAQIHWH